ncbi:MAG: hypothetical protein H0U26_06090 [Acidimicrobiia bacterium]|nr:hypothetical protein [Acidimicrobiia bacterium]
MRTRRGGGLSATTVKYVATVFGKALGDAVRWSRLVRNLWQERNGENDAGFPQRWRLVAWP